MAISKKGFDFITEVEVIVCLEGERDLLTYLEANYKVWRGRLKRQRYLVISREDCFTKSSVLGVPSLSLQEFKDKIGYTEYLKEKEAMARTKLDWSNIKEVEEWMLEPGYHIVEDTSGEFWLLQCKEDNDLYGINLKRFSSWTSGITTSLKAVHVVVGCGAVYCGNVDEDKLKQIWPVAETPEQKKAKETEAKLSQLQETIDTAQKQIKSLREGSSYDG